MKFDMKRCLQAFSLALDLAELDYFKINRNHSRRVAYISMMIATKLDLSYEDKCDLYAYAILHDNGLVLSGLKNYGRDYEFMPGHCIEGEANLFGFPFYKKRENVIRCHHEKYDGTGLLKVPEKDIPFFSYIIHLSDELDMNFDLCKDSINEKDNIENYIKNNSEKSFHPEIVRAALEVMQKDRFWFDLNFYSIDEVLNRIVPEDFRELTWEEVGKISEILVEIIDSKSKFTHSHTKGLVKKIDIMGVYYNFDLEKRIKMKIAGNLHDLGKLYVPNSILDKPDKLDRYEFNEIKNHAYYTKLALDKILGFEDISRWAANHHEKLNGKGYPEGLKDTEIDFESRMIAVLDIYQALTEERPYRKSLSHFETMEIMNSMVKNGFIDGKIVQDVNTVMEGISENGKTTEIRVLIVDDDKINIKILEMLLINRHFLIDRASDGLEALEKISKKRYKVLFSDVNMPKMSGIEVTAKIRETEKETGEHLTIIGITANATEENRQNCLSAGMDEFLTKPFDRNKLKEILDSL